MKTLAILLRNSRAAARLSLSRVEVGAPVVALLPLLIVAPLLLAGPIRCVTALSLWVSCAIACLLCAGGAWWFGLGFPAKGRRLPGLHALLAEGATLLLVGFAVWALYNRDFDGFMNLDGWDGGSHVLIKDQFAGAFPDIYNGQVSYYGFTWLIEKILAIDSFRSFTLAFYLTVVATVALPALVTSAAIRAVPGTTPAGLIVATTVAVLATAAVLLVVLLPLLHYNQAAGYYPHLFGLLPLLALWAADSQLRSPRLRLAALLLGALLLRYTYSLNLADISIAMAGLLLFDDTHGWQKLAQAASAAVLVFAGLWIATQIAPIFRIWGGIQGYALVDLLKSDLILAAALAVYAASQALRSRWCRFTDNTLIRTVRFPIFFAVANAAFFTHFREGRRVQYYYTAKYQMWACMLLALVLVVVLADLATRMCRKGALRSLRTWLGLASVAVALVVVAPIWLKTFSGYRTTLFERMRPHGPPYKFLRPLVDVQGLTRAKAILHAQDKRFGGYLTAFFPMFSFMNGTLGRHMGIQDFFSPSTEPGTCVFWVRREQDTYRLGPAAQLDGLRNAVAASGSVCAEYAVPWKATPQSLCYHCY